MEIEDPISRENKVSTPSSSLVLEACMVVRLVAHLGLRTHELFYEEIGNIIAEILSPWEKAEDFKEVGNHSQRIFTSVRINNVWFFLTFST